MNQIDEIKELQRQGLGPREIVFSLRYQMATLELQKPGHGFLPLDCRDA